MIAEALAASAARGAALQTDVRQKIVALDDSLYGERGRARHRMIQIGVTVLEHARAVGKGVVDLLRSST